MNILEKFYSVFHKQGEILVLIENVEFLGFTLCFMTFQAKKIKKIFTRRREKFEPSPFHLVFPHTFYYRQFLEVQLPLILTEKKSTLRMHWIMIYGARKTQAKKKFKAWKPWIQALGSFFQGKAWHLQGSVSSLPLNQASTVMKNLFQVLDRGHDVLFRLRTHAKTSAHQGSRGILRRLSHSR